MPPVYVGGRHPLDWMAAHRPLKPPGHVAPPPRVVGGLDGLKPFARAVCAALAAGLRRKWAAAWPRSYRVWWWGPLHWYDWPKALVVYASDPSPRRYCSASGAVTVRRNARRRACSGSARLGPAKALAAREGAPC